MPTRSYTKTDLIFLIADDALSTLFGKPRSSDRPNPSDGLTDQSLSNTGKKQSIRLMRVNHSGEICAQALYRGQALTARSKSVKSHMIQASREESDHLDWCQQRLQSLGGDVSILNPVWYAGSFFMGSIVGTIGDKWSLGFVAETENQVKTHLDGHLKRLPNDDIASHAIIKTMIDDESNHATKALQNGGVKLPHYIKTAMKFSSKLMKATSHWI
ncbi:MAG: demethoxyubiquinone hydroxylase family protein [Acidiferrobacteraceae bacterium]|jgi:ubiquinone biosynthesis monooxygenase Coq7|nr:demethoxyubiquinone hydroxylase family protein [Acidiferrobacteraceae bacterium]|tara:strand:+ start:759 stop:1403 length:645 start_codon:yes stop_codon:yes gene_type:complete